MSKSIYPCITISGRIVEAAEYYKTVFGNAEIRQSNEFVIIISIDGQKLMLLNTGPETKPNPSISFMMGTENEELTKARFAKLSVNGKILMPLDSYAWSSCYAWVEDQFGINWQLYTGQTADSSQPIAPALMFTGIQAGKAAEAISYYTSLFPGSSVESILNYDESDGEDSSYVKHGRFKLKDFRLIAMDSSYDHGFNFNDAVSLVVECDSQQEIDLYWEALALNGGKEIECGWLVDKYGLSWQIIPGRLSSLLAEPERAGRVMQKLLTMKKLVIADLENA